MWFEYVICREIVSTANNSAGELLLTAQLGLLWFVGCLFESERHWRELEVHMVKVRDFLDQNTVVWAAERI